MKQRREAGRALVDSLVEENCLRIPEDQVLRARKTEWQRGSSCTERTLEINRRSFFSNQKIQKIYQTRLM